MNARRPSLTSQGIGKPAANERPADAPDVSEPEDTRLDFEARSLEPMIRASVHYFNTEDEIARFCAAFEEIRAYHRRV